MTISEWMYLPVCCLVTVAAACPKTDARATPVAASTTAPAATTSLVPKHPSACVLMSKSDMEAVTHVTFATMEDENPPGEIIATCRYFMGDDHPGQSVQVEINWEPSLDWAVQRMTAMRGTGGPVAIKSETAPGIGDDALSSEASTLTVRKGSIIFTVVARLWQPAPSSAISAMNPALRQETEIARAVLAKL